MITGDGETGKLLVEHPDVDKVAFTGSTAVGREIGASAGGDLKRVTLELGGKSPNIILPDADIEAAVKGSFTGMYFNSGQACNAGLAAVRPSRACSTRSSRRSRRRRATTVPGPGLDPKTFIGPLVCAEQHERVRGYIDAGRGEAELVAGGGTDLGDGGYFVEPTLFTSERRRAEDRPRGDLRPGPGRPALRVDRGGRGPRQRRRVRPGGGRLDQGPQQRPPARLAAGAGSVYINTWGPADPAAPFGGFKASGIGREHGREGLDAYLETKSVFVQL